MTDGSSVELIVALGNPGPQYERTRHNAGFILADHIIAEYGFEYVGKKGNSRLYQGQVNGHKIRLIKPETYMNCSGIACRTVCQFFKIDISKVLVLTDDLDIDMGRLRLRKEGSAGTHNGLKSIVKEMGSLAFPRLRIGIGPKPTQMPAEHFVLDSFTQAEFEILHKVSTQLLKGLPDMVQGNWNTATKLINTEDL